MATSSNASFAPYDIDDESDSMELLDSLRENAKMYRRTNCVRFGGVCTGFFLTGPACCGSTHCTSTDLVHGVFTTTGNCACKDGFISNGDGTDCMPCLGVGASCTTGSKSGCCSGLTCLANKCNYPPPPPIANGAIGSYCGDLYGTGKLYLGLVNYGCYQGLLCSSYSYKCSAPLRDAGSLGLGLAPIAVPRDRPYGTANLPRGCGLFGSTCNSTSGYDMGCCGGGNSICTNGFCACKPGLVPDTDPSWCGPPASPASRSAIYDFGCDTSGKCRTWCGVSGRSWCYTGVSCNRRGITYPASSGLAATAAYNSGLLYPAVAAVLPDCNPDQKCSSSCNTY